MSAISRDSPSRTHADRTVLAQQTLGQHDVRQIDLANRVRGLSGVHVGFSVLAAQTVGLNRL